MALRIFAAVLLAPLGAVMYHMLLEVGFDFSAGWSILGLVLMLLIIASLMFAAKKYSSWIPVTGVFVAGILTSLWFGDLFAGLSVNGWDTLWFIVLVMTWGVLVAVAAGYEGHNVSLRSWAARLGFKLSSSSNTTSPSGGAATP